MKLLLNKEQTFRIGNFELVEVEMWTKITIVGYEHYSVSTLGRVRNKRTGKILKPYLNNKGYQRVQLNNSGNKKTMFVHRLVLLSFNKQAENNNQVNHKDGIKTNNYINNLEWSTQQENIQHAYKNGLNKGVSKITEEQIVNIIKFREQGFSYHEIAKSVGLSYGTVWNKIKENAKKDNLSV